MNASNTPNTNPGDEPIEITDVGNHNVRRVAISRALYDRVQPNSAENRLIEKMNLNNQYGKCIDCLKRFGFLDAKGKVINGFAQVPHAESALRSLSKEKLELASKFQRPTLLLVPIVSFRKKVEALDSHKQFDVKLHSTYVDSLYDGFGTDTLTQIIGWDVLIVDGANEMEVYDGDDSDLDIEDRILCMHNSRKKRPGEEGINHNQYIMLMMQSIAEGRPIDRETYTVFDHDRYSDRIACARFYKNLGRVGFECKDPAFITSNARFRSVVRGEDVHPE